MSVSTIFEFDFIKSATLEATKSNLRLLLLLGFRQNRGGESPLLANVGWGIVPHPPHVNAHASVILYFFLLFKYHVTFTYVACVCLLLKVNE